MGSGLNAVKISTFFILGPALLVSVLLPVKSEASVFSFISSLFSSVSASAEAEKEQPNSQNLALLQATISPNLDASSTKNEIVIVGGTSLSSETVTSPETNNLSGNTITIGQTLVILPISGIQHTVKSGDTLTSIAKQYKGDLDEILQYNNLNIDAKLSIGDVIVIPDGEISVSVAKPAGGSGKSSQPTYAGYYMRPIVGGVKTQGIHGNNGVDLASSYGSNILASADGQVIVAKTTGWNGGYGLYIVIKHGNGTQTLYSHLSKVLVGVGDSVTQGQVIGKMGSTGRSTGVHLHFEVRGARNPF